MPIPVSSAEPVLIRDCEERDVAAVTSIYGHYVRTSLATFEIDPPDIEDMIARRRAVLTGGYPYLIAEREREILGYTYASPYGPRPAHRYTAENSVYVRHGHARQGIGRLLTGALLAECERRGLRQIVAVIGDSANTASIALHRRLGFAMVGTLRAAGYKFGRWADVVLMQCALGEADRTAPC